MTQRQNTIPLLARQVPLVDIPNLEVVPLRSLQKSFSTCSLEVVEAEGLAERQVRDILLSIIL